MNLFICPIAMTSQLKTLLLIRPGLTSTIVNTNKELFLQANSETLFVLQGQNKELLLRDPDQLLTLVLEVIPRHSCLVFCSTKKNCQSVALLLVKFMPR